MGEHLELKIQKILLDGLRSLVYFIETDLKDFVAVHRRAKAANITEISFSQLWHLFEPRQEIISTKPKIQAYRVLQVTGGRRHLTDNKGNSLPSIANGKLTIGISFLIGNSLVMWPGVSGWDLYPPQTSIVSINKQLLLQRYNCTLRELICGSARIRRVGKPILIN